MFRVCLSVMLSCLLFAALWPPAEKGLTSWLFFYVMFSCVLSLFRMVSCIRSGRPYLIESIPDLCLLLYFIDFLLMDGFRILGHQIRISEILPWDRKSYLTHAILPRLSREGYIHWLYWNSRTLSSSDVIVM